MVGTDGHALFTEQDILAGQDVNQRYELMDHGSVWGHGSQRGMVQREHWKDRPLAISFWGLNGGLLAMTLLTLFPIGIPQAWTSYKEALWVARDASFFERPFVTHLGQLRMITDTVIIVVGVLPLVWFLSTTFPHLKAKQITEGGSVWKRLGVEL